MTREYFDLPSCREKPLRPASEQQQQEYFRLRSEACAVIVRNIRSGGIGAACPEVTRALEELAAFAGRHPNRAFRVVRPEDAGLVVSGEDPLCLR